MTDDPLPFLATFLRVADCGSFTAAARSLGITQAAVSQRIQMLEASLRTAVFRREAGRISLTAAGQTLREYGQRIADMQREARAIIGEHREAVRGNLRLAASSVPGEHLLPAILSAFRKTQPQIRVRLRISDTDDVCCLLERGEVHLGFTGDVAVTSGLEFTPFAGDDLVLVVPVRHRLAARRRVGMRDIVEEPFIVREPGSGSRHCLERALQRHGLDVESLNITLEAGGNDAIKDAIQQGLGVAILSRRCVAREIAAGSLVGVRVTGLSLDRQLYLVRNRRQPLPAAARTFLDQFQHETGLATS